MSRYYRIYRPHMSRKETGHNHRDKLNKILRLYYLEYLLYFYIVVYNIRHHNILGVMLNWFECVTALPLIMD